MKYYIVGAVTLLATTQAYAGKAEMLELLRGVANDEGVPFRLLAAICTVESELKPTAYKKFDGKKHKVTGKRAFSPSYGLCQIKLATAVFLGFSGKAKDLYPAKTNATYAAKYLHYQLDQYDNDWIMAVAAYNKGSTDEEISNPVYVKKVLNAALELMN